MSDDPKISERYRELPREGPPRHLDDAILAKARRAVAARPAPLVAPSGRRRWYVPLAAAAVIVLAVAVTIHVERERPDAEAPVAVVPEPAPREEPRVVPAPAPAPAPARKAAPAEKRFVPDPPKAEVPATLPAPAAPPTTADSSAQEELRRRFEEARSAAEAARAKAESQRMRAERQRSEPSAASAMQRDGGEEPKRRFRQSDPERPAPAASALGAAAYQSPEQWLLGIDDLKRQGRHEEAEKQLAEFRKRYPHYRIPEAILQKFEK